MRRVQMKVRRVTMESRQPAVASCLHACEWVDGEFITRGSLFCIGRRIGTQTNNIAEVRGLAFAAKAVLHLQLVFLEMCSRVAERHKCHLPEG